LDPVADLTFRVGWTAGLQALLDGKVTVGRLSGGDPLRADYSRVADVDHVRILDVESDPETGEEDRGREQHPVRPHNSAAHRPSRAADPQTPRAQLRERR